MSAATPKDVLSFWFEDATKSPEALQRRSAVWFRTDPAFDGECTTRFTAVLEDAARGALSNWGGTPHGRLALVILLDQMPRDRVERIFLYMPLQHAEDLDLQRRSVEQFGSLAAEAADAWRDYFAENVHYAREHHDIIERFGRFPHRNRILGRESTEEELRYLADGAPTLGQ